MTKKTSRATERSKYDGAGCQGVRFDDGIRAITTARGIAVGGLILDEMRATRDVGRGQLSAQLRWTLIWVIGLSALFSAAGASDPEDQWIIEQRIGPIASAVAGEAHSEYPR